MSSITKPKDFDGTNVTLTKPTDNKGIRMAWVKNDKKSLMFQVTAPIQYGASDFEDNKKFALTIAFDPENEKHSEFIKACSTLKKAVLQQIGENAKEFGLKNPKADMETITSKFYELTKAPKDDSESSLQLMKLNLLKKKDSDEFDITLYDNKNTELKDVDVKAYLRRGAMITAVISVKSVWVNSKKEAGIKMALQRARIDMPAPASGSSKPFDDMEDMEDVEEETSVAKAVGGAGTGGRSAELEEDEDDVLADVTPAPAPAPASAAKAIEQFDEDDGEVVEAPPAPKKETKVVKKVTKKPA